MAHPIKDIVRRQAEDATTELREKVRSKMDVGKFFAGFITLLIGILLKAGGLDSLEEKLGIVFLISSLGYCIAAVFSYDRLLMPREYWTALTDEEEAEEPFRDLLRELMVRSWRWLFVPAVWCFGIGFLLVLGNALSLCLPVPPEVTNPLVVILLIAGVVAPVWAGITKGPKIYD